jgi:hypothetical protein
LYGTQFAVVLDSKFKDLIHQTHIQERNITGKEHVVSECQLHLAEDIGWNTICQQTTPNTRWNFPR